jgi:RimJ/RimL family protein N-acetyltransferase
MLRGEMTGLRARLDSDIPVLHAGLYDDVATRVRADSLADNNAMIQAASRAGFAREGTLRCSTWVNGDFTNEVILGLLSTEWKAS